MQDEVLRQHLLRHIDKRHIRAHGVTVLVSRPVLRRLGSHPRAIFHEGIVYININRCTVALRLPVAWHSNLAPATDVVVLLVKVRRPLLGVPAPVEQPLAVEAHDFLARLPFRGQLQRGVVRQFVDAEHCGVFPVRCSLRMNCEDQ